MRSKACLFVLCCLVAVPALAAEEPALPVLDLSTEVLATPAFGNCSAPLAGAIFTASRGSGGSLVTCIADCGSYPDVSCSTSGTCTAVDRNCPTQRGYVQCGSTVKYCPVCECTEGSFRFVPTGNCCDCGLAERERQQCINGTWEFVGLFCGPGPGCPLCP